MTMRNMGMTMRKKVVAPAREISVTSSAYVMPFKRAMQELGIDPLAVPTTVSLSRENLEWLIKVLLRAVEIDENWYRTTYPDVDVAIKQGAYKSAKHHFVEDGYFEGRRPGNVV